MRAPTAAIALLLAGALAGCSTASGGLLDDYNAGDDGGNYVSGDGTTTAIVAENRGEPIEFAGETELGDAVSSEELLGMLRNMWTPREWWSRTTCASSSTKPTSMRHQRRDATTYDDCWLDFPVTDLLRKGWSDLSLTVEERNPHVDAPLVVRSVEAMIRFGT